MLGVDVMRTRSVLGTILLAGLVAASVPTADATSSPPSLDEIALSITGDPEVVFDWTTDACEPENIPDLASRAFRDAGGTVHLPLVHYRTYQMLGSSLDDVAVDCNVVLGSNTDADPSHYDDRQWLASPYTLDGETVYGLVHNEYQGNQHPGQCPSGDYATCLDTSITLVVSTDGGMTYSHAAPPPDHLVATEPYVYAPDNGPSGTRSPSNIVKGPGGFFYSTLNIIKANDPTNQFVCLMRTDDLAAPDSWRFWDGDGFDGVFTDPYTDPGGQACSPLDNADLAAGLSDSLVYNRDLDAYVLIGPSADFLDGRTVWGFYYALSRDLVNWTRRRLLTEIDLPWTVADSGTDVSYLYPSLLDPDSPSRNFETTDDQAYLYYTRNNHGQGSLDRDLIRVPVTFSVVPPAGGVQRLSGDDRYATAAQVALDRFDAALVDTVYLAVGSDFPDALAGGPLAAADGAPILLTPSNALPDVVAAALAALGPTRVVALGGTGAVAERVLEEAAAAVGSGTATDRISGSDRFATAAAIAAAMDTTASDTVYLATGRNFPDALAGGPASMGAPILLVEPAALPPATAQALAAIQPTHVVALGGQAAVSDDVLDQAVTAAGGATPDRLSGTDRYRTATAIAATLGAVDTAYVAVGTNFPDALAAGTAAVGEGAPIVLTRTDTLPDATRSFLASLSGLRRIVVLGGVGAVSDAVRSELAGLIG